MHIAFLLVMLVISAFGQPPVQHTEGNADQALRGSGRVNASTLAMEFELPLGSYPGRGINVPISLSYSSKLWRMDPLTSEPRTNGSCFTINGAVYGENSKSGWTTTLDVPYIEYVGWTNVFSMVRFPKLPSLCQEPPPEEAGAVMIRRVIAHLPNGETHELRDGDGISGYNYGTPPSKNGTFYAADGSISNISKIR